MAEFINTVDIIGDELLTDSIINRSITEYNDNKTKVIGKQVFRTCTNLTTINCPEATSVYDSAFMGCTSLAKADFSAVTSIKPAAFNGCSALATLIIRRQSLCSVDHINAIYNTPIANGTGYIYVPRVLVDSYKTDSNWKNVASQFRAIEDYPEICG